MACRSSSWTGLREVEKYFVERLDDGEGSFFEKLKSQLVPTSPETRQLVAEMLWVMLLCPDNVGLDTERDGVRTVWNWSTQPFPEESEWVRSEVLSGIGSGGVSYSVNRWREIIYMS
jgi:5-methylcytosine-specific restriction protein B